ncbi:ABC transporter substrate-binding protein [Candidatus Saccharibacteria bacterium]|nr:ABC transporter substrate-binding protein [Candidatus Saccharibacteria bacterium]
MKHTLKKRGQKIVKKFSRASLKAGAESKEHIKENFIQRISHIRNIRLLVFEWVLMIFALIMLAVAQSVWFGDSYATNTFVDGGSYIEATIGRVNSLNPLFATTNSEKVLSRLMFATLVENDYSGNPGLGLADSLKVSEDGKVWTLKLRDGLFWSDGEPISNEDVMFTINLLQNPAANSIYDANLENVKVQERSTGEIVFTLPSQYSDFISALNFPVVPKHELEDAPIKNIIEDDFSTSPVTSGAFKFNATQTMDENERIVFLSANDKYFRGRPMLDSFAVHTFTMKEDIMNAIKAGSVTATAELSGPDVKDLSSTNFLTKDSSVNAGVYAFFNMSRGELSNVDLRRAIRQGIDVEKILSIANGTQALKYPLLESQIQLEKYPEVPGYDFEAAKSKIAELTKDKELNLNIVTVNSGYLPEVAGTISESLNALGVKNNVSTFAENQEFLTNIISKRNYDILIYNIELGSDPDPLAYYHSSQATASGLNLSNYRSTLVDDLLIGARETMDRQLREKKYESFLNYWVNDVPAVGLYRLNLTYIYNKNVRAFGNDVRLVTALDRFVDVTDWASVKGTKNKTP